MHCAFRINRFTLSNENCGPCILSGTATVIVYSVQLTLKASSTLFICILVNNNSWYIASYDVLCNRDMLIISSYSFLKNHSNRKKKTENTLLSNKINLLFFSSNNPNYLNYACNFGWLFTLKWYWEFWTQKRKIIPRTVSRVRPLKFEESLSWQMALVLYQLNAKCPLEETYRVNHLSRRSMIFDVFPLQYFSMNFSWTLKSLIWLNCLKIFMFNVLQRCYWQMEN